MNTPPGHRKMSRTSSLLGVFSVLLSDVLTCISTVPTEHSHISTLWGRLFDSYWIFVIMHCMCISYFPLCHKLTSFYRLFLLIHEGRVGERKLKEKGKVDWSSRKLRRVDASAWTGYRCRRILKKAINAGTEGRETGEPHQDTCIKQTRREKGGRGGGVEPPDSGRHEAALTGRDGGG